MNEITNRFLQLFYKISEIPRESGKEERFANFLEKFAIEHNLEYYRDDFNNVLIKKNGNKSNNETIILQAHIDMVCVKRESSKHNFNTDPIEIIRNGDVIYAKDTSLGADQGIGLAIMLLILESSTIKHPNLECMFTTEEETTFNGVVNFDYSKLNGKRLINLDHCKDDTIVIGCDADICNKYIFEETKIKNDIQTYEINIKNINGGNSGIEIERSSRNAITLMGKLIQKLQIYDDVYISSIDGGKSENDIASSCKCVLKTKIDDILTKIRNVNIDGEIEVREAINNLSFSLDESKKIISEIISLNQGIVEQQDNDIVVSGNIGLISTMKNMVTLTGILRSINVEKLKKYNINNIDISRKNNFSVEEIYQDSAWLPNNNSKLQEYYKKAYLKINGTSPSTEIVHGGLECSSILKRMKNLDIISIGSIIQDFHTVNERMYISSCEKTIKTLLEYLKS